MVTPNTPKFLWAALFVLLFFNDSFSQTTQIDFEDFESGWGIWNDGGDDCSRETSKTPNGTDAILLRGNTGSQSTLTTDNLNLTAYDSVELRFEFETNSMENGEDFFVEYYDGASWIRLQTFVSGSHFNNGVSYTPVISLSSGSYNLTSNSRFRIQCDASNKGDQVFIDNIEILGMIDTPIQAFFDSDGDGVFDDVDIDDDNDGILDIDEERDCKNSLISVETNYKFLNETFGTGGRTTINTTYDAYTSYCYEDGTSSCNTVSSPSWSLNDGEYAVSNTAQIANWAGGQWWLGEDHTEGDVDGRMAVFNASYDPGIFYTADIRGALPNIPITYSFWIINLIRTDANGAPLILPDIKVEFRDKSGNVLINQTTGLPAIITTGEIPNSITGDEANSWYNFTADLTFNVEEFEVYFINNQVGGNGNDLAIDDIVISQTLCDTDSDTVADVFDLDSDNDGIPDVVENGFGHLSNGTAKIDFSNWIDANGNGMHDAAEGILPLDTDGDGVPNYLDLDSDNDGIFDVDESGAGNPADPQFQNGDGDISGDGVGQGPDSDAVRETDKDSDGVLEYYTDGILDVYDFYNGSDFDSAYGNENQGPSGTNYVVDTDGDGIPDYLDTTSNGTDYDISGTLYSGLDMDGDGIIDDATDTDGDGIVDIFDTNDAVFGSPRNLNRKLMLYFDGRNDYVQDGNVFSNTSEISLMTWIRIDPTATGTLFVSGQDSFNLVVNSDKSISVIAGSNTLTSDTVNTNQWVHIAASYSNAKNQLRLFINGEEVQKTSKSGALASDSSAFTIGKSPSVYSNFFKGYIDEVRVFDKALTDNEMQKIIYQEIMQHGSVVRGLVVPLNVNNFVDENNSTELDWSSLTRYFRMDAYKGDVIDDLTTNPIDSITGARIYNIKRIAIQSAPMPFETFQAGDLASAVHHASRGINGNDAMNYDWSIVKIHHNVSANSSQKHLGLFVDAIDTSSNPIEFSVSNDSELNISWYLKLDGSIDLEGESQLVQGAESILDQNSGGFIERDQQGTANSFNYNYWSSSVGPITPVGAANGVPSSNENYTISNVLYDGTYSASPKNINFQSSFLAADSGVTDPAIISSYWLYAFYGSSGDYNSWQSINENSNVLPGQGYTMKGTSGAVDIGTKQNYVFKGKPNNGNITLALNKSAGDVNRLIGNPYPSALDAHEFILDNISDGAGRNSVNVFNGALYFWDHFGQKNTHVLREYVGGYATYTLLGGVKAYSIDARIDNSDPTLSGAFTPERYIPLNQGFFVSTSLDPSLTGITSVSGGQIVFKNSQRVFQTENSGNSTFLKVSATKNREGQSKTREKTGRIRLHFRSANGYHRTILIGEDERATKDFDLGFDAPLIDQGTDDMFWLSNNQNLVIQGVNKFKKGSEFPLGIEVSVEGQISIGIQEAQNVSENASAFIKDKIQNETFEITDEAFLVSLKPGSYLDRFSLVFQPIKENEEEEEASNVYKANKWFKIHMNNRIEQIEIENKRSIELHKVVLLNNLGQPIQYWKKNLQNNINYLSLRKSPPTGIYVVQLYSERGIFQKKIIIK